MVRSNVMPLGAPEQGSIRDAPVGEGCDAVTRQEVCAEGVRHPRSWHLFSLAAETSEALEQLTDRVAGWLESRSEDPLRLAAALRRQCGTGLHRRGVVARDAQSAACALRQRHPESVMSDVAGPEPGPVAFLFPGGGAQRINMGRELYGTESVFRRVLDESAESLRRQAGLDIRQLVFAEEGREGEAASRLGQVDHFMPVLFGFCHALARQWMAWGVQPVALLGHSLGEYVAATLAGVFESAAGMELVTQRGTLIQKQPAGAMLVVWLSEDAVRSVLFGRLAVAAVNGPELCVVSGPADEIEGLEGRLVSRGATTRRLQIDHAAHSWMMEGAMEPLAAALRRTPRSRPVLPYVSNVTGTWMVPDEAVDPEYYARHLRQPVRFADGLSTLLARPKLILLEVGPGQALSVLARQHPQFTAAHRVVSSLYGVKGDEAASLMFAVGRLWGAGVPVEWDAFDGNPPDLPQVPAEWRDQNWVGGDVGKADSSGLGDQHLPREGTETALAAIWVELLKKPLVRDRRQSFFDLGGYSLLAVQLVKRVRDAWRVDLSPQTLLASPSLEGVARVIDAARADQEKHPERAGCLSLMRIQGDGTRPPLFVVPGGNGEDGELYVHAGLSEGHYGPDQPVYGFRRRGWDGRSEPHRSVPEMARDYIAEMRTIQPTGPFFLHGDCAGGPVAYEMAGQLRDAGERVGMLLLTDSLCPRPFELQRYAVVDWARRMRRNPAVALVANLVEFITLRGDERRAFFARKREAIQRRLGKSSTSANATEAPPPVSDPIRGGLAPRHVGESEFWTPDGLLYWRTIQRSRPRPYAGVVHLIVSEERARLARIRRWRRFAADTRVTVVPGSHWLYLWHHGDQVAARIRECQRA
jgi:malonyl CoA-acyl carrier protein transacylase/thioesterase domain-containing protein